MTNLSELAACPMMMILPLLQKEEEGCAWSFAFCVPLVDVLVPSTFRYLSETKILRELSRADIDDDERLGRHRLERR